MTSTTELPSTPTPSPPTPTSPAFAFATSPSFPSPTSGASTGGAAPGGATVLTVGTTTAVLSLSHSPLIAPLGERTVPGASGPARTTPAARLGALRLVGGRPTDQPAADAPASIVTDRRGGFALAVAIGLSSMLSFAVHALASRQLSVADYGALAAVLAIMTAAAVPVGAVQTALTRSAAEILARGERPTGRRVLWEVLPAAAVVVGFAVVVAAPIASFLNLSNSWPVIYGGLWIAVVLLGAVGKALLIADASHRPVAHAIVHGSVIRLGVAAVVTPAFGVAGGVAAAVIGDVAASLIYLSTAARRRMLGTTGVPVRVEWPDAGRALSAQLSLWLFASLAVVIGRRALNGQESGSFAAMATAAVACLFLPQAVATIVFPRFVADGSRHLLIRATLLAGAVGALCAFALGLRPDILFLIFFGPQYVPQRLVLLVLCAHFVLLGCLTVLTQYVVARRQGGTLAIWSALTVAAVTAVLFGDSPMSVAVAILLPTIGATIHVAYRGVFSSGPGDSASSGHGASAASVPEHHTLEDVEHGRMLRESATLDVSIVIPTFNGGVRLAPCVASICDAFDRTAYRYEVVVAVDGSTDGSELPLIGSHPNVVVERLATNRGKGAALRQGFSTARGRVIGFIDGDGDIAPQVMVRLVDRLLGSPAWVAVASKNQPGATVNATRRRRVMSAAYRLLVHWMFDLRVTDTQCGCKAFRREFLASTIDHALEDGFAFDLELLCIGNRLGLSASVEVPVVLVREEQGTVSTMTALRMFTDTLRIRRRLPQATWAPLPLGTLAPAGFDLSSPLLP